MSLHDPLGTEVRYGYDLETKKSNSLWYISREHIPNSYNLDYVPLDDEVILIILCLIQRTAKICSN